MGELIIHQAPEMLISPDIISLCPMIAPVLKEQHDNILWKQIKQRTQEAFNQVSLW